MARSTPAVEADVRPLRPQIWRRRAMGPIKARVGANMFCTLHRVMGNMDWIFMGVVVLGPQPHKRITIP